MTAVAKHTGSRYRFDVGRRHVCARAAGRSPASGGTITHAPGARGNGTVR